MDATAYEKEYKKLLKQILNAPPIPAGQYSSISRQAGVYLFSKECNHLYIGTAINLWSRCYKHIGPSASESASSLLRNVLRTIDTTLPEDTRKVAARDILSQAECRTVDIPDTTLRRHFERYAIAVLRPLYNR